MLGFGRALSAVSSCESLGVAKASRRLKMWTDDAREKYRMIARGYPSSMSDAEWALVKPYFPSPAATAVHGLLRGRDMLHPMRPPPHASHRRRDLLRLSQRSDVAGASARFSA